jgi:hypothetical protein
MMDSLLDQSVARLGRIRAENSALKQISESQAVIVGDIESRDADDLSAISRDISATDAELKRSCNFLTSLLTRPSPPATPRVGNRLSSVLTDVQTQLRLMCLKTIDADFLSVPITALVDLEDQIGAYADEFVRDGLLPESATTEREEHSARVMAFLGAVHRHEITPAEDED